MARLACLIVLHLTLILALAGGAQAQTNIFHLHKEASTTTNLFQLKTSGPDGTSVAAQSANLKNVAAGEYLIKAFDTQAGVPNSPGQIPSGSTITLSLWMNKTGSSGTMYPRAKLYLNSAGGTLIGAVTGTTALTTTLTKYTLTFTTTSNINMTSSDRFYLWVGVNLTAAATANNNAALNIEGTLNGNYDSQFSIPAPIPPPSISGLSPSSGNTGTSVTVTGSNFGATQGASTVTFNGVAATPTSWSNTGITAPVPASATTGPVIVTVGGNASNSLTYTVATSGSISGKVTKSDGVTALIGTSVKIYQGATQAGATTTNSTGDYSFSTLNPGTYRVEATYSGYGSGSRAAVVTVGVNTAVNFSLEEIATGSVSYIYDELGRLSSVEGPC